MKKPVYFSLFILLLITVYSSAQSEHTTHWYFGNNAGLDFSSGTAVAFGNSGMLAREGSTTYSDINGNLLFYSNGVGVLNDTAAVWNRNHEIMPNGLLTNLTGNASPMQSSLVVPIPGSSTQYYLFTLDGYENYNSPDYKGLRYSIVDMSLDGGLGDVIDKATPVNAPATPFLTEQIAATRHSNGSDYWLILHESNNINLNSNKFILYLISSSGIGTPIIQNIGNDDAPGMQGTMQVSSQGDKVAFNWEVFDFDNSTGVLSNPVATGNTWGYREFSRSGRFLYVAKNNDGLYQYDLDALDVPGSEYQLSSLDHFGQIQIGLDDKIYIAMASNFGFQPSLSVINNPDQQGASSGFTLNAINLIDGVSSSGLPNFIDFSSKNPVGISDKQQLNDVFLYPNPAHSNITLNFNNDVSTIIELVDIQGKPVLKKEGVYNETNIDLSSIRPGNYFIKIEQEETVYWKQLVVE